MDEMNNFEPMFYEPNVEETPRYSEAVVRRAPLMAKWLRVMFWANIAHTIINFIKIESSVVYATIQNILIAVCVLLICLSLFKMRVEDARYGRAALFQLIPLVFNLIPTLVMDSYDTMVWLSILVALISAVLSLLAPTMSSTPTAVLWVVSTAIWVIGGRNCGCGRSSVSRVRLLPSSLRFLRRDLVLSWF